MIIGIVSQKGGVGKSTLARALACEYTLAGWQVKIADLDTGQATSRHWQMRRLQNGIQPDIAVESFGTVAVALKAATHYDLMIMDGAPHATQDTVEIAQHSDLPNGAIPEKVSYRRGSDLGYALTETRQKGLKQRADQLIQSIIDTLN